MTEVDKRKDSTTSSKSSKSAHSEKAMMSSEATSEPGKEIAEDNIEQPKETITIETKKAKTKIKMPPAMTDTLRRVRPTDEQLGTWNVAYVKTPRGLLKLIALLVACLLFVLSIGSGTSGAVWSAFMGFAVIQFTLGLLLLHVIFPHVLDDKRNATSMALLELVGYALFTLTFVFVFLTMVVNSIVWGQGSSILAVVISIVLTAVCAVLTFLNFVAWRNEQAVLRGEQTHTSVP